MTINGHAYQKNPAKAGCYFSAFFTSPEQLRPINAIRMTMNDNTQQQQIFTFIYSINTF